MPTYDYRCTACGVMHEIFHSMTEKPRRTCPGCGKNALERQLGTGGAIIFKGSGFYQTDYRSESYKKSAQADTPSTTAAASADTNAPAASQAAPKDTPPASPSTPAAVPASASAPTPPAKPVRAAAARSKRTPR